MAWSAFNGGRFMGIIIYCVYCENLKHFSGSLVGKGGVAGHCGWTECVARGIFKNCFCRKVYRPQLGLVSRKAHKSEYEYFICGKERRIGWHSYTQCGVMCIH